MKNKILLNLGIITTIASPLIATTISCSKNNNNNSVSEPISISKETQKKYYDILWNNQLVENYGKYEYVNKLASSLFNTTPKELKTIEEVQKISDSKLANITENQLKELMLNSAIKGCFWMTNKNNQSPFYSSKNSTLNFSGLEIIQEYKLIVDIQNFKYDKHNQSISFTYVINHNSMFALDGVKSDQTIKQSLDYKNIKLSSSVFKINDKVMPIITFSENQPNASIEMIDGYVGDVTNLDNFVKKTIELIKKQNPNLPINESENKNKFNQQNNKLKESFNKIKALKNVLGQENGKFKMVIDYNNYHTFNEISKSELFDVEDLGYYIDDKNVNEIIARPRSAKMGSPIFFSTEYSNGQAKWEIYNLKTIQTK